MNLILLSLYATLISVKSTNFYNQLVMHNDRENK